MFLSDEMGYKASTVMTFIDELQPILKAINPGRTRVHYWSDSPTSTFSILYPTTNSVMAPVLGGIT